MKRVGEWAERPSARHGWRGAGAHLGGGVHELGQVGAAHAAAWDGRQCSREEGILLSASETDFHATGTDGGHCRFP